MTYLYGIVFFSHQVGSFTGVWLGGVLHERFGNYDGVWIAGIILGLIAAFLHFYIDEKSYENKISTTVPQAY
jgi:predicted MFS family arabinose efflux permease